MRAKSVRTFAKSLAQSPKTRCQTTFQMPRNGTYRRYEECSKQQMKDEEDFEGRFLLRLGVRFASYLDMSQDIWRGSVLKAKS